MTRPDREQGGYDENSDQDAVELSREDAESRPPAAAYDVVLAHVGEPALRLFARQTNTFRVEVIYGFLGCLGVGGRG
jgi:hypothetical protein